MLQIQNIRKKFVTGDLTQVALDGVSLNLRENEFVAILGPSGSGKTTLLNIIGLTDLPTSGTLIINGNDIYKNITLGVKAKIPSRVDAQLTDLRRSQLGFIFQTFNLVPVLNVWENIELPLHLGKSPTTDTLSKKEQSEWISFLLEMTGLTDWKTHKPAELSGGQRQRTAIARALVTKAPIILADEPTANLDSQTGDQILELMQKLNKELNTTFIFSTHDSKIVEMANHVIKIKDGIIL